MNTSQKVFYQGYNGARLRVSDRNVKVTKSDENDFTKQSKKHKHEGLTLPFIHN